MLHAQSSRDVGASVSRASLEAQLHTADSLHRTQQVFSLRRRLTVGDFEIGDRIHILLQTSGTLSGTGLAQMDTLIVKAGRTISMPEPIGDINLTGVLFSELSNVVNTRIAKYYRDVTARVTPLLRLSVSGATPRAGYYYIPTDSPLSDLIMRSGGQAPNAELGKSEIRRGTEVIWNGPDVQLALTEGVTVDGLGLRPGDDLFIAEHKQRNWIMPALTIGASLVTLLLTITR